MNTNEAIYDKILSYFSKYAYDICQTLANAEPNTLRVCVNVQWWQKMGMPKTLLGQKIVPMEFGDIVGLPMFIDWTMEENGV